MFIWLANKLGSFTEVHNFNIQNIYFLSFWFYLNDLFFFIFTLRSPIFIKKIVFLSSFQLLRHLFLGWFLKNSTFYREDWSSVPKFSNDSINLRCKDIKLFFIQKKNNVFNLSSSPEGFTNLHVLWFRSE